MSEPTSHSVRTDGENAFRVTQRLDGQHNHEVRFSVDLPHQCDEWLIAYGRTRAQALADLDAFIAEAQEARALLAEMPDLTVETHSFVRGGHPVTLSQYVPDRWLYACHAVWADGQRCKNQEWFRAQGEHVTRDEGSLAPDYVCRRATP